MGNLRDFFLQLSTSLSAGVALARTLHLLGENVDGFRFRAKVEAMAREVEKGKTLSSAMEKAGKPFTGMQISFIKFGEQTGTLPEVCANLAEYADKEMNLESEVLTAMAYPLFLLFLALMVMPIIEMALSQAGSSSLVWGFMRSAGIYTFILAALFGVYQALATPFAASILIQLPFFGMIFRKMALCRFTRSLGVGLQAGVTMNQCLETSISVTANPWLEKELSGLHSVINRGGSLAEGLKSVSALPSTMKEMIVVGEQSGKLPEMLKKTSDYFEED
ncbi:MAG: type II secretion system F family protein, partial [Candidatus Riflebacteria bacterium]